MPEQTIVPARFRFFIAPYLCPTYNSKVVTEDQKSASREALARNLEIVREKIAAAVTVRPADDITSPGDIRLVAVSKTFSAEITALAAEVGATDLGESRVQEGSAKIEQLGPIARWHMIGHLQKNKARQAVRYFDMIHSLDSYELAKKVSTASLAMGKKIDCLIELNSSGEAAKFGFDFEQLIPEAARIIELPGLNLCGLMTIGPLSEDVGQIKKAFEKTYDMYEAMKQNLGRQVKVLSMGMSGDFELAIECGSNMVRVGTGIFGHRA